MNAAFLLIVTLCSFTPSRHEMCHPPARPGYEDAIKQVQEMQREVDRIIRLIEELQDMIRKEAKKSPTPKKEGPVPPGMRRPSDVK